MAAVAFPSEEKNSYFQSSAIRRSRSQPKFMARQSGSPKPASPGGKSDGYANPKIYPDSAPSTASSSPRIAAAESSDLSYASTPSSSLSLASDCDDAIQLPVYPEDHFVLPQYPHPGFGDPVEDLEPPTSPKTGDSYPVSPVEPDNSDETSRPDTPELKLDGERAEDDTAVRQQPTRHVDYLSHNWREEDIWSSWRYIISRRDEYSNSARLENASWRTWMKAKNNLRTVSPETLNWFVSAEQILLVYLADLLCRLKDCDVTWLYGPLQIGSNTIVPCNLDQDSGVLSKNNSFLNKKPILKKRSMSEVMLQKSLSASSLVKTAAAAVQAQELGGGSRLARPTLGRAISDCNTYPSSRRLSPESSSVAASTSSSGLESPSAERKHIHFNEQVEQCIAVDVKGEDDEDDAETEHCDNSDSDEGAIMMKRSKTKKRRPTSKRKSRRARVFAESKTIAMLPSTTLKYREDTPEPPETAMKHTVYGSPGVSPSSSQETLRPSKSPSHFLLGDDDDDAEEAMLSPEGDRRSLVDDGTPGSANADPAGMRRTASGMLMPYEDGDVAASNEGIFGRVVDTVNTARDIAHVIWNVGWRK